MISKRHIKALISNTLCAFGIDAFYRYLNRNKLLVVMYHGVCRKDYNPPIWTQLPSEKFEAQIAFLNSKYNLVSLSQLMEAISEDKTLPERAALITFDDGLRNNYSVAFPILKKYKAPAAIFVTVDYIDTDNILWFDELLFLIEKGFKEGIVKSEKDFFGELLPGIDSEADLWTIYCNAVEKFKRIPLKAREENMNKLRDKISFHTGGLLEDFGILSAEQMLEMDASGLIEFGAHTANHRILTNMDEQEWEVELKESKAKLEKIIKKKVHTFCFPNGRPRVDFNEEHVSYLKECSYKCSFTTENSLYSPGAGDPFYIGRVPAGNDFTSHPSKFRLATAGF